jgi:hypothetical protein
MESLNNGIENNRRLAVIEESINRALLYDDNDKKVENRCNKLILQVTMLLGVGIIAMVIVVIIIVFKKIN